MYPKLITFIPARVLLFYFPTAYSFHTAAQPINRYPTDMAPCTASATSVEVRSDPKVPTDSRNLRWCKGFQYLTGIHPVRSKLCFNMFVPFCFYVHIECKRHHIFFIYYAKNFDRDPQRSDNHILKIINRSSTEIIQSNTIKIMNGHFV